MISCYLANSNELCTPIEVEICTEENHPHKLLSIAAKVQTDRLFLA